MFWEISQNSQENTSHTKNCTQGYIASKFFLMQTAAKLRNSQVHKNYQLWYSLNYSNFFQVFVNIFQKHIIRKIFPKYMDPVTCLMIFSFSTIKVLLWHHYQVIHCYENLRYSSQSVYVYFYIIIYIFM